MSVDTLNATVRVTLSPSPGFCIKSTTVQPALCKVTGESAKHSDETGVAILPSATISIPKGQKVFINFAWDANVPPPPEGNEEEIQRAIAGEQEVDENLLAAGGAWFVPVIVSEPRSDVDKAGKPSAVFDCVYNASLKSRALKGGDFRAFLIELGIQRIEAQHSVALSRQLGTPNIASKGKLAPRTALVPLRLYPAGHPIRTESEKQQKALIQEIVPQTKQFATEDDKAKARDAKPKGILKNTTRVTAEPSTKSVEEVPQRTGLRPKLDWTNEGDQLKITVYTPNVTHDQIENAALDVEPRRVILNVPGSSPYTLDVDLSMSDAQLMATFGGTSGEGSVLMLKRQRDFDVDGAKAEWHVREGRLVLYV